MADSLNTMQEVKESLDKATKVLAGPVTAPNLKTAIIHLHDAIANLAGLVEASKPGD